MRYMTLGGAVNLLIGAMLPAGVRMNAPAEIVLSDEDSRRMRRMAEALET